MPFEDYLRNKKHSEKSIKEHLLNIKRYLKWCSGEGIGPYKTNYNQLLKYIEKERESVSPATINNRLNSIEKYNRWLQGKGLRPDNPSEGLRLSDAGRGKFYGYPSLKKLPELYASFRDLPPWAFAHKAEKQTHPRNVAMFGLMVFQGLHSGDLGRLEKSHLYIKEGKIYVPGSKRSNSRVLPLDASQLVQLSEYAGTCEGKLFGNSADQQQGLMSRLRHHFKEVLSPGAIRAGAIMRWLQTHDIRKVQYMSGHKHIGSTERYLQLDIHDLKSNIERYHPMK